MRSFRHWSPRYIRARLAEMYYRISNPDAPWLTPCAVQVLDRLLRKSDIGVEFGSGRSTVWLAKRVEHLTSIEHHEGWFTNVQGLLKKHHRENVNYRLIPQDTPEDQGSNAAYVKALDGFAQSSIDFVFVDGMYRDHCALGAIQLLRPGGVLIIDNVNWFLPSASASPNSRTLDQGPNGKIWSKVHEQISEWRTIWTTSGVSDTACFIKPVDSSR